MRKQTILTCLSLLLVLSSFGKRQEVHILSVNDMHANINAFPQLAAIADSLRSHYPSLLILSAGDNRTGDPINDMYDISSYPMVTLMNMVGFHASALGNHEFDVGSLPPLIGLSNFSYVCANLIPSEESKLHVVPTKYFDVDGLKVGIIGAVQINGNGHPDTHPDNIRDLRFSQPASTIAKYRNFSHQCDVTILLSHLGYQTDCEMAKRFPWIDLIVGGHTHTQLTAEEPLHNGVLITQNKNKLAKATHITLTINKGRVIKKTAEYIDIPSFSKKNMPVEGMVAFFSHNPAFSRVVGQAAAPFKTKDQLTFLMCDALLQEGHGDISIINNGGVRIDSLAAGDITIHDIFSMDPFSNVAMEMDLTGEEIMKLLMTYSRGSLYHLPRLGGLCCEAIIDKDDPQGDRLMSISLKTLDGQDFDISKTYKVITSSYVTSVCGKFLNKEAQTLNQQTSMILMRFLEDRGSVNYEGVNRLFIKKE